MLNNENEVMSKKPDVKDTSAYRLRSQKRSADGVPIATGEKAPVKAPQTSKMENKPDMDALLSYLKEAQEKTEKTLMEAIELSKQDLKEDMAKLTTNVGSIRTDLTRIEETFGSKIERLQTDLITTENKLKVAVARVERLEEGSLSAKNEKTALLERIRTLENDLTNSQKTNRSKQEALRKDIRKCMEEQKTQMLTQAARLDALQESTLESLDKLNLTTRGNACDLRQVSEQIETLDNKSRKKSIVIEGLPEKDNDEESKQLLVGYIQKILPDFKSEFIDSFYRIGRQKKNNRRTENPERTVIYDEQGLLVSEPQTPTEGIDKGVPVEEKGEINSAANGVLNGTQIREEEKDDVSGPSRARKQKCRSTVIGLTSTKWRETILARAADIRTNTAIKGFWINRDQNENIRRKHQLVKACYERLQQNEYPCSMKGSVIMFRGRRFDYEKLNLLPELCTPYDVKTRETIDGKGLCFQSEHVFCSNFASAKVKYEGVVYPTVEHAYQCIKAQDAGYIELAEDMRAMRSPYRVKKLGGDLPVNKKWKKQSEQLMGDLI